MEFSINVLSREVTCDTSAGFIRRETHKNTTWQQAKFEVCSHKWCDMSETDGGVAIINDGKYGIGLDENHITLSLLRANIRPDISSDIGYHEFCYQILPHKGNVVEAKINQKAFEYNVILEKPHLHQPVKKELLQMLRDLTSLGEGLFLQALKISEDEERIIVRLSEQDGRRGKLKFSLPVTPVNMLEEDEGIETHEILYKPFEIITVAVKL